MTDFQPLWDWFREFHATTGIKLTIFYDAFDRARFFNGFLTSVRLMALCIVASVAIGILGAWVQGSRLWLLRAVTAGYIYPVLPQYSAAGPALFLLFRPRLIPADD
jgi:ABC-type spermidine/putrescine transport system permease subunit II